MRGGDPGSRCHTLTFGNMNNPPLAERRVFWICALVGAVGSLLAIGFLELFVDYNRDVSVWLPLFMSPLITLETLSLLLLSRYP